MNVDRSHFLLVTAALAAGGAGGWVLRDRDVLGTVAARGPSEPITRGEPTPGPEVVAVTAPAPPPAPLCDDSVGTAEACPQMMGPSEEGVAVCSNVAAKRCADFKASFKPKVAANAVACIRRLKGAELCDLARVNLCGHAALMAACQDVTPPGAPAAGAEPALKTPPTPVVTASTTIVAGCGSTPLPPTLEECRRTLSGMNDAGRANAVSCMATHCADKGLLGCEAVVEPKG